MPTMNSTQSLGLRQHQPASVTEQSDSESIAFRRLALQLHHDLNASSSSRSVLVVSPDDAGACAMVSSRLACCMAEELAREVLLADATREGRLSVALAEAVPTGLNDFLSDPSLPLEKLVLPTSAPGVAFLPSGSRSKGYDPDHNANLLRAAGDRFNFVVVAAGAILNDPFALASAPLFGAVLLLVIENETPTKRFEEAAHALKMCGVERLHLTLVHRTVEA